MKTDGEMQFKILVVDDDVEQAMSTKYQVGTAHNRTSGMEEVKAQNPDLIILDVMMEGRHDGFEVARELKKDPQSKHTPILMFTSIRERSGTDFKSEAGDPSWLPVEGYLDKTAEPEVLIAEVERLLAK